jgi:hypothetical protein
MSINLLPDELKPNSTTLKASKKLRKVSILMLTVFVIAGLVVGGVVLVFSNLISLSDKKQATLKSEITALEQTETRLVLIKDRLGKIGRLEQEDLLDKKIGILRGVIERTGELVVISDIVVDKDGISLTAAFANSIQLGRFLADLNTNDDLSNIRMDDIKYFSDRGYEITLTM